ncbi:Cyclin [Theobroma cacao]|uniref:Cyclin-D4-1 n=1 Tax=Theobroma cacao TaxID=3641 RepID=A0AB32VW00_THECC|nr:PREDICTED: cyclin-D4-1 [Theobroma cacao]XP_017970112.1 PREDICTED: cyclin-D4-1 [Theobroma cacao]XP_017970113.1 PREDICTED: cyclin-D4-1 [Theobroma cacao]WRX14297.1 Cyclin [Theobroma cacao]
MNKPNTAINIDLLIHSIYSRRLRCLRHRFYPAIKRRRRRRISTIFIIIIQMSLSQYSTHLNNSSGSAASSSSTSLSCGEDAGEVVTWEPDTSILHQFPSLHNYPPSDVNSISELVDLEPHHMPFPDYLHRCQDRSIDVTARQDSINWILKVHAYYHFSPVTAFLSVNYFDRFLSSHSLPQANGWPFQLLSVACLSLAAKMEEPQVPLLLDLQVFEPRFVFEPKTIQRMELRVMATLNWRLRSVTPFDYLHHFICKLPSCSTRLPNSFSSVVSASSDLILSTTRVIDFLGFGPSTIAAAAVLCAAGEGFEFPADDAFFHETVNKEMVGSCHQLMEEYLIDTCPSARLKELRGAQPPAPPSPVGVLDAAACGSCDTRSENPGSSSQEEPPAKRLRSSAPDVQQP